MSAKSRRPFDNRAIRFLILAVLIFFGLLSACISIGGAFIFVYRGSLYEEAKDSLAIDVSEVKASPSSPPVAATNPRPTKTSPKVPKTVEGRLSEISQDINLIKEEISDLQSSNYYFNRRISAVEEKFSKLIDAINNHNDSSSGNASISFFISVVSALFTIIGAAATILCTLLAFLTYKKPSGNLSLVLQR